MLKLKHLRSVSLALLLPTSGAAGAAGRIDPDPGTHGPLATEFAAKPGRAVPTPGSACEVADSYVTGVEKGAGAAMAPLFAPDAKFLGPVDRVMRGRAEIGAFYARMSSLVRDAVSISFVDRGNECFMELAVNSMDDKPGHYRLLAIDHFTIDQDRLIRSLVIYFRPASVAQAARMK